MIIINNIKYDSYLDMCKAFDISYAEFIQYRKEKKDISELELIGHFIDGVAVNIRNGEYATITNKVK